MTPDITKLQIGDTVTVPVNSWTSLPPQKGKVVYIHPKRRFFTVQFDNGIKESYCAHGSLD
jgi:hypothetical protein